MDDHDDITMLLKSSGSDPLAAEALYEAIYDQLRGVAGNQMRAERPDHTLQATALANEAYLKLIDQDRVKWQNRVQFFAVASRAIRRILVDHARRRGRHKRGAGAPHLSLTEARFVPDVGTRPGPCRIGRGFDASEGRGRDQVQRGGDEILRWPEER